MKNKILGTSVITIIAGVSASLLVGCGHAAAQTQGHMAPSVTVAPVEQKEIVEWSEFTGRTEPVDSVEIRPRTSGYIQEVRFQSGQLVKKGDVLFVIDPPGTRRRLINARPSMSRPKASQTALICC